MNTSAIKASFGHNQYNILANSQGSSDRKNQEYKKILCAYHPTEFLTNFYVDSMNSMILEACLMPLCPTCVVEHT